MKGGSGEGCAHKAHPQTRGVALPKCFPTEALLHGGEIAIQSIMQLNYGTNSSKN